MDILSSSVFKACRSVPNRGNSLHLLHSDAFYLSHASYICVTLLFLLQRLSVLGYSPRNVILILTAGVSYTFRPRSVLSAPNCSPDMLN